MTIGILRALSRGHLTPSLLQSVQEKDSDILHFFAAHDHQVVHVFLEDFESETESFEQYYCYDEATTTLVHKEESISCDVVWNMMTTADSYVYHVLAEKTVICGYQMVQRCQNKYLTSLIASSFQPKTELLRHFLVHSHIQDYFDDVVVLKPLFGCQGKGIIKITKTELLAHKEEYQPQSEMYIVQGFIDTSRGAPSLCETTHDMRLCCVGTDIVTGILRTIDKKDEFRAVVHLGGSGRQLDYKEIPADLLALAEELMVLVQPDPCDMYSLDFSFDALTQQRYLIEMNSAPRFRTGEWPLGSDPVLSCLLAKLTA